MTVFQPTRNQPLPPPEFRVCHEDLSETRNNDLQFGDCAGCGFFVCQLCDVATDPDTGEALCPACHSIGIRLT